MKKIIAIALCSVCCGYSAAQSSYTLEQILDSARQNNIAIRSARQNVEAASQQRKEAFTKYFPNISGTGLWFNANRGMAQTTINPSEMIPPASLATMLPAEALAAFANPISVSMLKNGTVAGITAVQPVFAGGQIVNGNRLARVGEDVSRLKLQLSENEVERTAEQYFWQIVSLQEKMRTVAAVEAMLADIHKDVGVAVRAGVALRNDLLQVQLRQNEVESQKLKLQNGISIVKLLLAQYSGLRDTSFTVQHSPSAIDHSAETSRWRRQGYKRILPSARICPRWPSVSAITTTTCWTTTIPSAWCSPPSACPSPTGGAVPMPSSARR